MTTYNVREFKASVSRILRNLDEGDEVIITRRGKPRGRLTAIGDANEGKPSLEALRGSLTWLPEAVYEDFMDVKAVWEPRVPSSAKTRLGPAE
ncbi:MAG: type II toxin-antitoxin system Phd/YefM family antitoxin [Chloroflexi bacterium]|nr:type II toxin-antitoxin system Phd/YefM family antitoxin [Chloroflexota bacterium]